MKWLPKIALFGLISATAGVTGAVVQHKFFEPKVVVIHKIEKPTPVVQPKKEPPKTEAPKTKPEESKSKPKEDPPKQQSTSEHQVKKVENKVADTSEETKNNVPSHRELKKFWNRMYELNGMLNNNIDDDGFFPQVEISWIKEVRKQLRNMSVPNDPQAEKYYRTFKDRMDTVWFWIFDGEDDMQAQQVLDEWSYESEFLFPKEYADPID